MKKKCEPVSIVFIPGPIQKCNPGHASARGRHETPYLNMCPEHVLGIYPDAADAVSGTPSAGFGNTDTCSCADRRTDADKLETRVPSVPRNARANASAKDLARDVLK